MLKIVADDKIPFLKDSPLKDFAEITYLPGKTIDAASLRDADALITRTRTQCRKENLEGSRVRFIATATIGFDHIDVKWVEDHGIVWRNAPGCNARSVGQYMASLLLNLNVPLRGKTLGIIGVGHVGKEVHSVAEALGMKVLLNDPPRADLEKDVSFTDLDELLEASDFVTTHVPLENGGKYPTFHMADRSFFAKMKRTGFYINASRGDVCDNEVLKEALKQKRIAGAALDVWESEPELDRELMNLVRLATPHIAGYSTDGKANGTAMSVRSTAEFFHLPGLEAWYPAHVPAPENTWIDLHGGSFEEMLREAVNTSYDITQDDARLRNCAETFEKQRGNYPLRREFPAFTVRNSAALPADVRLALEKLHFRLA